MNRTQIIFFTITIAITMSLITLILTTQNLQQSPPVEPASLERKPAHAKRVSRFLQQKARNPNAADHCHMDNEVCDYIMEGRNSTCCNNKCVDLEYDSNNCGACKNKCAATETCCRGECVNLAFDKRHCGFCNSKCMKNGLCIYGICDYA